VIRTQPCPIDLARFLVNGVRHHRKRMHVQPNTRTLNTHRRPPDLQILHYQRECSPTPATHESFCSMRPSASAGLQAPTSRRAAVCPDSGSAIMKIWR
jgi:hypothetical protein